jgi:hypothetical protein
MISIPLDEKELLEQYDAHDDPELFKEYGSDEQRQRYQEISRFISQITTTPTPEQKKRIQPLLDELKVSKLQLLQKKKTYYDEVAKIAMGRSLFS